jgi:hypothetical protein
MREKPGFSRVFHFIFGHALNILPQMSNQDYLPDYEYVEDDHEEVKDQGPEANK